MLLAERLRDDILHQSQLKCTNLKKIEIERDTSDLKSKKDSIFKMYVSLLAPDSGTLLITLGNNNIKKDREDLSGERGAELTFQPSSPNPLRPRLG